MTLNIEKLKKSHCRDKTNCTIKESENGSCFIATAVYGLISAPEVVILRRWRDEYLLQHLWGKLIVSTYYKVGPFLAKISGKSTYLKRGSKFIIDIIVRNIKNQNAK